MSGGPSRSGERNRSNSSPRRDGVGPGDAQGEADGRVGGRAPALAVDVLAPAELHDVPDDEEVAGEARGCRSPRARGRSGPTPPGTRSVVAGPVAGGGPRAGPARPASSARRARGGRGSRGAAGPPGAGRRRTPGPSSAGPGHRPGPTGEAALLLGRRLRRWAAAAAGSQPSSSASGRRARTAARAVARGRRAGGGVVDVVGGHEVHPRVDGQVGQGVVAGGVERVAVVPQLHRHVLPAEGLDQPVELPAGRRRARRSVRAVGTAPLRQPVRTSQWPPCAARQVSRVQVGAALSPPARWASAMARLRRAYPSGSRARTTRWVPAGSGSGPPPVRRRPARGHQGELGAEDGRQPHRPGRLGEADHPVEAVVVGEGEGAEAEPGRLGHELLGVRGTVEEAEVGVAVQLGVAPVHRGLSRRSLQPPPPRPTDEQVGRPSAVSPACGPAPAGPDHHRSSDGHGPPTR